ncbi:ATP-grasp domain-containing protein [Streptomyces sp. WM6372]|uniref:ATP-grasp domain-containing protein n=1 Tax=Streptomyces sp. WM6372 TaxID=1415555 RepID=UPI0006ADDE4B|nr:ATP-grasp domain-containing protein [Streptomyces sp. WM6372]
MPDTQPTVVLLNPRSHVLTAARKLGAATVTVPEPGRPLPADGAGLAFHSPWTTDPEDLIDRLRALDLPAPVSCFGFGEIGCVVAALVNRRLGWPGNPPEAMEAFKDKAKLRSAVGDRAGAPVAYRLCTDKSQIRPAVEHIGYPCIVKPADGTGSAGVRQLAEPRELDTYLAALDFTSPHLVEEFLVGTEYSVEATSSSAGHRILAITEKATTGAPGFVETGHTLPVRLAPQDEEAVAALVTATLDAAGYRTGPSHTEVMLTAKGPRLIESHGRPGGDRISDMLDLALGEDVFEQAMADGLGLPVPGAPTRDRVAGIRYVTFDRTAPVTVTDAEAAKVAALPGVTEVAVAVPAGQLPPEVHRSGDRHGFVVAHGANREELESRLDLAVRTLTAGR